jgi:hypothetical protein
MAIDLMKMALPSKKKIEVEIEPNEEMGEMGEENMEPSEEEMMPEMSPLAEFDDAMLLEECKKRGLV